jgi:Tfp pilus assembly protein PilN
MIRVNLIGDTKNKSAKVVQKTSEPISIMPILLILIVAGAAAGCYWWYSSLNTRITTLNSEISAAQAQKAQLEAVIKQDQIYESRKKAVENRIMVIEGLKRNQVSPVVSLDMLSNAVDKTQFVWLSQFDQNNTIFSMAGIGTSVNAIADFVTNLEGTGYFHNINLVNAQDASGNYTFSMTCEFAPPVRKTAEQTPSSGGN